MQRRYPPSTFPGIWRSVETLVAEGRICATEEVKYELDGIKDDARQWARGQNGLFVPLDKNQTDEVSRIMDQFEKLVDYRGNKSGADPFVIALARVRGCAVVSQENRTNTNESPHIPNVCDYYRIECISVLTMFEREGWSFP